MSELHEKTLSEFLGSIRRAVEDEDGSELCRLLNIDLCHRPSFIRMLHQYDTNENVAIDVAWKTILDTHMQSLKYMNARQFQDAFNMKAELCSELARVLQTHRETNWCVVFMNQQTVELRLMAIKADMEADAIESAKMERVRAARGIFKSDVKLVKKNENMERACESLMQFFRVCATDTRTNLANSKRIGMIYIVNQLFKIYFRINKLHLCKPLIRAMENANIFDSSPLAQRVTYNYYLGLKTMFDLNIKEAERLLDFVLENCHPASKKNQRLTLIFLIPIKMLLGRMPSSQLMETYDLQQFDDIKRAVIRGHIGDLDRAIENNSDFLWNYGIYFIIELLKPLAMRNLFKKVAKCAPTHLIDLNLLVKAVKYVQPREDINCEEVHCLLANLISQGKIKGYLSVAHNKLVLSKANPFPPIAEPVS